MSTNDADAPFRASFASFAASAPLFVAVLGDPARDPFGVHLRILGLSMGVDAAWTPPVATLLGPLATLIPIGDVAQRFELVAAIPAALVAWSIARRTQRQALTVDPIARAAIVVGVGGLAGVLALVAGWPLAFVAIAIERAFASLVSARAKLPMALATVVASAAAAVMIAPISWPIATLALLLATWGASVRGGWTARQMLAIFATLATVAAAWIACVVERRARLSLGLEAFAGAASSAALPIERGVLFRAIGAAWLLASLAWIATVRGRSGDAGDRGARWDAEERAAVIVASACAALSMRSSSSSLLVLSAIVLLPTAAASLGAVHAIVAGARVGTALDARWSRRLAASIVPALLLGLGARTSEAAIDARLRSPAVAAAARIQGLATLGRAAPRSIVVVDAPARWRRLLDARATHALRPDLELLPVGRLVTGANRVIARALAEHPSAGRLVRLTLGDGVVDEASVATLLAERPLVVDLPAAALALVARHLAPVGGALSGDLDVRFERADPSDRRADRLALARDVAWIDAVLARAPADDPLRVATVYALMREARVMSFAGDREAATHALDRLATIGVDAGLLAQWRDRVAARATLANEPLTAAETNGL